MISEEFLLHFMLQTPVFCFLILSALLSLLITCRWSRQRGKTALIVYICVSLIHILSELGHQFELLGWLTEFVYFSRFSWHVMPLLSFSASIAFLLHVVQRCPQAARSQSIDSGFSVKATNIVSRWRVHAIALIAILIPWSILSLISGWWSMGILFSFAIWSMAAIVAVKSPSFPEQKVLLLFILSQIVRSFVMPCIALLAHGYVYEYHLQYGLSPVYIEILGSVLLLGYVVSVAKGLGWKSWNASVVWIFLGNIIVFMLLKQFVFMASSAHMAILSFIAGILIAIKYSRPLVSAGFVVLLQVVVFWPSLMMRVQYGESRFFLLGSMIFFIVISAFFTATVAYASKCMPKEDNQSQQDGRNGDASLVSSGVVLASRWKRLWGVLLDSAIMLVIAVPFWIYFGLFKQLFYYREPLTLGQTIGWALFGIVLFLIVNGWLLLNRGQTLGKRIVGTRIVRENTGQRLSFGAVYGMRYLLPGVLYQIPILNFIFAFADPLFIFGKRKRCIHDWFAGSIVIDVQQSPPQRIDEVKDIGEQSATEGQDSMANPSTTEPVVKREATACDLSCKSRFVRLESLLGTSNIRTRCVFFGANAQNATKENGDAMFLFVMQRVLDLKLPMPLALEYVQIHLSGVRLYGTGTTLMLAMSVPFNAYDAFCEAIPHAKLAEIGEDGIQGNPPSLVNKIRNDSNPITCWYYQPGKADILTPRVSHGKYGFIDESGAFAIKPEYDMAWPFFNGLARVKREGKCGFVDEAGSLAIPLQFDDAYDFSEGYARFRSGKLESFGNDVKYGYIDPTGKVVMDAKYAYAEDVVGGKANVSETGWKIDVELMANEDGGCHG